MKKLALWSLILTLLFACVCLSGCSGDDTPPPEGNPPAGGVTAVTGVTLDKQNADLDIGATLALVASVSPENATDKSVTWSSSDTAVATVANGTVTAVGEGTAVITVTTTDGSFSAACTVRVHSVPTVSFYLDGELYHSSPLTAATGGVVTMPQKPADATDNAELSVYFSGWYLDEELLVPFDGEKVYTASASVFGYMADFSADTLSYEYDSTYKLYYVTGFAGQSQPFLVIPSAIDGNEIYGVDDKAFQLDTTIRRVIVMEGVKKIGDRAFERCTRLSSLTLANSVRDLCEYAFAHCRSLKAVRLPEGLVNVESREFSYCTSLSELIIPATVTTISYNMFEYCESLREVTLPEGLQEIRSYAFSYCTSLESVVLPTSLNKIGDSAFVSCENLLSVTLPAKKSINMGSSVFRYCDRLVEVIDKGGYLNSFGVSDGYVTTNALAVHADETRLAEVDGFVFYSDTSKVRLVAYRGNSASVVLPADFEGRTYEINKNAFLERKDILSVTLPAGVTGIGTDAFSSCENLLEVVDNTALSLEVGGTGNGYVAYYAREVHEGESKLVTVGDFVFYVQDDAKTLVRYNGSASVLALPESISGTGYNIGKNAFGGNTSLAFVVIPEGVQKIESKAFDSCLSLVSVTLPSTLQEIGGSAFYAPKLVEVVNHSTLNLTAGGFDHGSVARYAKVVHNEAAGRVVAVGDYLFFTDEGVNYLVGYTGNSGDLVLPSDYQGQGYEILPYAFYQRRDIYTVVISDGVTAIGASAFQQCERLGAVVMGENILKIGNSAFNTCYGISSIVIPAKVSEIGSYAFGNCSNLTMATFACKTGWKVPSDYGPFTVNESKISTPYAAAVTLTKTGNNGYGDRVWTRTEQSAS